MNQSQDPNASFLALRDDCKAAQLATLAADSSPEASYAPCVWHDDDCYLFLSELASHTGNLMRNPKIGLMLIEAAAPADNPFARRRLSLQGTAREIGRDGDTYDAVIAQFHRRFGKVMQVLETLPDFHLFGVAVERGSYIQGFGQAYELTGEKLDRLVPIDPRK